VRDQKQFIIRFDGNDFNSGNDVRWDTSSFVDSPPNLPRPKTRTFSVSSGASVVSEKRRIAGLENKEYVLRNTKPYCLLTNLFQGKL